MKRLFPLVAFLACLAGSVRAQTHFVSPLTFSGSAVANSSLVNLGGSTVGIAMFKVANPGYVGYCRINADNSVTILNQAQLLSALGLTIGTNVQAWDAELDTWATKTPPSGTVVGTTDTQTLSGKTLIAPLGLVKADVGLGNVDNTSDLAKPISTATQTALDLKLDDSQATAFGLSLLDDADATAGRTTLGLGTLATQSGTFSGTSSGLNTGDQTITLTGDVTGSGTGSFGTTVVSSSTTTAGKIETGTDAEVQTGSASNLAVVPSALSAWWTWVKTQAQTVAGNWTFNGTTALNGVTATTTTITSGTVGTLTVTGSTTLQGTTSGTLTLGSLAFTGSLPGANMQLSGTGTAGAVSTATQIFSGAKSMEIRPRLTTLSSQNWTSGQWVRVGTFVAGAGVNPLVTIFVSDGQNNSHDALTLQIGSRGYGTKTINGTVFHSPPPAISAVRMATNSGGHSYVLEVQLGQTVTTNVGLITVAATATDSNWSGIVGWNSGLTIDPDMTGYTIYPTSGFPTTGSSVWVDGDHAVSGSQVVTGSASLNGNVTTGTSASNLLAVRSRLLRGAAAAPTTYVASSGPAYQTTSQPAVLLATGTSTDPYQDLSSLVIANDNNLASSWTTMAFLAKDNAGALVGVGGIGVQATPGAFWSSGDMALFANSTSSAAALTAADIRMWLRSTGVVEIPGSLTLGDAPSDEVDVKDDDPKFSNLTAASFAAAADQKVALNGEVGDARYLQSSGTSVAPSGTAAPVAWSAVTISGTTYKIPLYQ